MWWWCSGPGNFCIYPLVRKHTMFTSLGHIPLDVLWTLSITQECLCEHTKHKVMSSVVHTCNCQITSQSRSWLVLTKVPSKFPPYFQVPAEVPLFHFIIHYCPHIINNVTQTLQLLHYYPIANIIRVNSFGIWGHVKWYRVTKIMEGLTAFILMVIQSIWYHILEDLNFHQLCCVNLRSCKINHCKTGCKMYGRTTLYWGVLWQYKCNMSFLDMEGGKIRKVVCFLLVCHWRTSIIDTITCVT